MAAGYDEVCFAQVPGLVDKAIQLLAAGREDTVLDVATGPGTLAVRLAPHVRRVIAIDFAEMMIERLRGHIMRSRLSNLEARVMNGQALAFDDESFDAAVSMFGVFLFEDRARGLEEMFRVTVPGGPVLFSSWAPPEQNTLIGAGLNALRAALPELPRPKGPLPTQQPEVCAAELSAAGFESVETELFQRSVSFDSVDQYWENFERAAAPLAHLRQKLGEAAFAEATGRARRELQQSLGSGPISLDCVAIFTFGDRARARA